MDVPGYSSLETTREVEGEREDREVTEVRLTYPEESFGVRVD